MNDNAKPANFKSKTLPSVYFWDRAWAMQIESLSAKALVQVALLLERRPSRAVCEDSAALWSLFATLQLGTVDIIAASSSHSASSRAMSAAVLHGISRLALAYLKVYKRRNTYSQMRRTRTIAHAFVDEHRRLHSAGETEHEAFTNNTRQTATLMSTSAD